MVLFTTSKQNSEQRLLDNEPDSKKVTCILSRKVSMGNNEDKSYRLVCSQMLPYHLHKENEEK
jgi:hypothetical protein